MNLLVGCKVIFRSCGEDVTGIVVKADGRKEGSYLWVLMDGGQIFVKSRDKVKISEDDIDLIKEFSGNRVKRLKMMERATPIPREELIDLD